MGGLHPSPPLALLSCTVFALASRPAAALAPPESACRRMARVDPVLQAALEEAPWLLEGHYARVAISGLRTLDRAQLGQLVALPPGPLDGEEALRVVAALSGTGLFARITPQAGSVRAEGPMTAAAAADAARGDAGGLVLAVVEHERVGAVEGAAAGLADDLLDAPSDWEVERSRDPREGDCPQPLAPRDWYARAARGEVHAGVVWKGLGHALERAHRDRPAKGGALTALSAELSESGALSLRGGPLALEGVELRGLESPLREEVLAALDLHPGQPLDPAVLEARLDRLGDRWPFLERSWARTRRAEGSVVRREPGPSGSVRYRLEDGPPAREDEELLQSRHWREIFQTGHARRGESADNDDGVGERFRRGRSWFELSGRRLVLHLRARRSELFDDWAELFRHTPQTGFAPGLALTERIYDPTDRVHLLLDGLLRFNTRRTAHAAGDQGFFGRAAADERLDWLAGLRLRIPALQLAELGAQVHVLTDTADRWRIDRIDSYLGSVIANRPDSEYFRRSGLTALATAHLFRALTAGAEYRRDRYQALEPLGRVWTVFHRDEAPLAPAQVLAGTMGSLLFRLEWGTAPVSLHEVGGLQRAPESPLAGREEEQGVRVIATLELGSPALGGDQAFRFLKVLGDARYGALVGGDAFLLLLRGRVAGGPGLPPQKEEALGGWSALRGYGFKELRGDGSVLAQLELRQQGPVSFLPQLGGFLDLGAVHERDGAFTGLRAGAGALVLLDERAQLAFAWRLDSRARAAPEVRLLFSWPLGNASR